MRQPFVFVSGAAVGRYSALGEEPRPLCGSCLESFLDVCGVLGLTVFNTLKVRLLPSSREILHILITWKQSKARHQGGSPTRGK